MACSSIPKWCIRPRRAAHLRNFVRNIAGIAPNGTWRAFRAEAIARIRKQVGKGSVICGLSGGVDSAVAAVLIHEAIGDQLTCIFVDHGLMRAGEAEEVVGLFRGHYNIPLVHAEARELFLGALDRRQRSRRQSARSSARRSSMCSRRKRRRSRRMGAARRIPGAGHALSRRDRKRLGFTGGPSVTIKSHHNVGGLPERMKMKLVEPLRELFKDEVRALGRELGLPRGFRRPPSVSRAGPRHPLPGEITPEKLEILRKADAIYLDEIRKAGLYDKIWQAFAVLLPVKTVGVMGDGRTYDYVCALRAVTSSDGMTADFYPFDTSFLARAATRIVNEVKGINRVVYDVTSASRRGRSSGSRGIGR